MTTHTKYCTFCGKSTDALAVLVATESSSICDQCAILAHRIAIEGKVASGHPVEFDLINHLYRQRAFSRRTFGPGPRTQGVLDHIRKELAEIEANPGDIEEWSDLLLLALDGAWRAGFEPEAIAAALEAKQTKNEGRTWPDWRTAEPGKAIEHVRDDEVEHHPV